MNKLRKQSDATYGLSFLMVDSTDHVTGKTGLSPTVTISKNLGSFASPSGAVSEIGNGWYKIAGNATDSDTLGELLIHATGTAADPSDTAYTIVAYDPMSGPFPSNMTQIDGAATNGNNASLYLKTLHIKSNTAGVSSLTIAGYDGLTTGNNGGNAVSIIGGVRGDSGATGGNGIVITGGSGGASPSLAGYAMYMVADGAGGGKGIRLDGGYGNSPLLIQGDSYTPLPLKVLVNGVIGSIYANLSGSIGSLATRAKADVNAEVKDVLETDTQAEPTSPPSATSSLRDKIAWLFTLGKNKRTQTATTETVLADNGTTPIATSEKSDTGGTFTRGKFQ